MGSIESIQDIIWQTKRRCSHWGKITPARYWSVFWFLAVILETEANSGCRDFAVQLVNFSNFSLLLTFIILLHLSIFCRGGRNKDGDTESWWWLSPLSNHSVEAPTSVLKLIGFRTKLISSIGTCMHTHRAYTPRFKNNFNHSNLKLTSNPIFCAFSGLQALLFFLVDRTRKFSLQKN